MTTQTLPQAEQLLISLKGYYSDYDIDGMDFFDPKSGDEMMLPAGFRMSSESVSDDACDGGRYYTEYTARLAWIKLGSAELPRDFAIAAFGKDAIEAAERQAANLYEGAA